VKPEQCEAGPGACVHLGGNVAADYITAVQANPALWSAAWHDFLVMAARHPVVLGMMKLARVTGPVRFVPGIGYIVADPALAREILLDESAFSKSGRGAAGAIWNLILGPMSITGTRGDDHRMLRHLLAPQLNRTALDVVEREVLAPTASRLAAALDAGEAIDLAEVGRRLALDAVCAALGIPRFEDSERAVFFEESDALFRRIGFRTTLDERSAEQAREQVRHFTSPVARAARSRTFAPGRVLDAMAQRGLGVDDQMAVASILLLNGTGASSAAIPRVAALVIDSGQLPSLRTRPDLIPRAAEEGLRYVTPSPFLIRAVEQDRVVQGARFRAGRRVVIMVEGATRARDAVDRPEEFRVDRDRPSLNRIWFGAGRHLCPGADLGQREIETVLRGLAMASRDVRIVRRRYRSRGLLPTYRELVVTSPR
jgi:cytochrome P450